MTTIRRLITAWMLTFAGSLLFPVMSIATVTSTTHDLSATITTLPAITTEHTTTTGTVRQGTSSNQAQALFGLSRSFLAPKTTPVQLELDFGRSLPWQRGESGLVIGRGADLAKPGALGPGEYKLSWFSVQETSGMEAEWAINQSKLSKVMDLGKPIRDASSIEDLGGFYLNRERYTQ